MRKRTQAVWSSGALQGIMYERSTIRIQHMAQNLHKAKARRRGHERIMRVIDRRLYARGLAMVNQLLGECNR